MEPWERNRREGDGKHIDSPFEQLRKKKRAKIAFVWRKEVGKTMDVLVELLHIPGWKI